jgi:asparagine synthase (glutamine-hydrolysing)
MRRLSIIDVAGGHQPIYNEDGSVAVVFNGEIYNYHTLRSRLQGHGHQFRTHTDTEVIVHAYEEEGTECVERFNGIFAFALWDARTQRLFLARDRMGVKPLYYVQWEKGLAFASEIKALLTLPEIPRILDLEATAQFFRFGFVPPPRTLFQGIRKLPPGWWLTAQNNEVVLKQYWDMEFKPYEPMPSFAECCEQLRIVLQEAVTDQMVSDVPLGAFLSGGIDSSAVVAFMRQASTHGVRTYSIGFDQRHAYHNEAPYAEAVARELGTQHETLIVQPQVAELMPALIEKLDEPLTDTSFLVTYLVSELAHQHVKVALSGVGGDELFGGYRRYLAPSLHKTVSWIPQGWRKALGESLSSIRADRGTVWGNLRRYAKAWGRNLHLPPEEQYLGLISVLSAEHVATLFRPGWAVDDLDTDFIALFGQTNASTPLDRLLYVDAKTVLPESLLLLSDKMGMATSLEVRVPFLDNRVVDFVCRIPSHYRLRGFMLKRLLKVALKGVVPDSVLTRSKRGFGTPMSTWLRTDLRPMVAEFLAEERLQRDGLLNANLVRDIIAMHDTGREDYTEAIFALLAFELWREQFQVKVP